MKQYRRVLEMVCGLWGAVSLLSGCSDPSCEDLANCTSPSGSPAGSSGLTSSSGNSTGSMGNPENCTNGVDDDNDGTIDCADTECLDKYTCLPAIPAGFTEIVTIAVTPYGEPTAPCAGGTMAALFYQTPAADACDACTCDASGVACTPGQLATSFDFGGMGTCANQNPVMPLAAGECRSAFGSEAILLSAATTSGSCLANTSSAPPKPPMETTIATCSVGSADGRGCGMSGTCVPSDGLATAEHLCIKRPGHEVCPGEWPLAIYAFESFVDERTGCTPCGCSASCEGGQFTVFPDDQGTCAAGGIVADTVGVCLPAGTTFNLSVSMSPLMASCMITGGEMMGSVKPMTETTFCCY